MVKRDMGPQVSLCNFLVLSLSIIRLATTNSCADFVFPQSKGSSIKITEHTQIAISFNISHKNCTPPDNFTLRVTRESGGKDESQCSLWHRNWTCLEPAGYSKCSCGSTTDNYLFHHNVTRADGWPPTEWVWSTEGDVVDERTIHLDVTYPAEVKSLAVNSNPFTASLIVDPESSVDISCTYDEGNPQVKVRLLDRHGVEMEGSIYSSGQIRYTFPAVGCQDAGLIRCEAPGASHNKTVLLLVRCVPRVQEILSRKFSNGSVFVQLQVLSHTEKISRNCTLQSSERDLDCRVVAVKGTPPDLLLTVKMSHVTSAEEATGTLTLKNDAGTGDYDLGRSRNEDEDKETEDQPNGGQPFLVNTAVTVGCSVVTVVVIFALHRGCRKSACRSARRHSIPEMPNQMALQDRSSDYSVHYYFEVPDSPVPSDDSVPSDELLPPPLPQPPRCRGVQHSPHRPLSPTPPRDEDDDETAEYNTPTDEYLKPEPGSSSRDQLAGIPPTTPSSPPMCHGPGNPPDAYLKPAASRDEEEDEGSEFNTVPFYGNTLIRNVDPDHLHACDEEADDGRMMNSDPIYQNADRARPRPLDDATSSGSMPYMDVSTATRGAANVAQRDSFETDLANVETDESDYVPYCPQGSENTPL